MLTITHPQEFLGVRPEELAGLPHVRTNREEKERRRREEAEKNKVPYYTEEFHGGEIVNTGRKIEEFRNNWIEPTSAIARCFNILSVRLVYTEENRPSYRWKFECRYDWGNDSNLLPKLLTDKACDHILKAERLSVRQLWLNPTKARFGNLQIPPSVLDQAMMANLMVGPIHENMLRRADIRLLEEHGACWVEYEAKRQALNDKPSTKSTTTR